MTKMGQKLIKIVQKLRRFFVHFHIYTLKNFAGGGLRARPSVAPSLVDAPADSDNTIVVLVVIMACRKPVSFWPFVKWQHCITPN